MKKLHLVLADTDTIYLKQLTNFLLKSEEPFTAATFTEKQSLQQYLQHPETTIDMIAWTPEMVIPQDTYPQVILSEVQSNTPQTPPQLFKYQKMSDIVTQLRLLYAEMTGDTDSFQSQNQHAFCIGCYSPIGGSGKTTLALQCAKQFVPYGKRVLYLNCERISSAAGLFPIEEGYSMSDVYLGLKTAGSNIGLKIMTGRKIDPITGIAYLLPPESSLEGNELSVSEWKNLFHELKQLDVFDILVVDWDSELSNERIAVLDCCDRILMPFLLDNLSLQRMQIWQQESERYDTISRLAAKSILIANKVTGQTAVPQASFTIPYQPILSDAMQALYTNPMPDIGISGLIYALLGEMGGNV